MTGDDRYPADWDDYHPSEADEELFEPGADDDPTIPTIDGQPLVPDHSDRGAGDYVVSGPLGDARGHGRRFATVDAAWAWAVAKFGAQRVRAVQPPAGCEEEATRWAIRVRRS